MTSDAMNHPWAKYIKVLLDGQELKHCRFADEENGCAEVYHVQVNERGHEVRLRPDKHGTRMLWGKVELVATEDVTRRILADPCRAQEIWDAYEEAEFGDMKRELAASGWPKKRTSFERQIVGLDVRRIE